MQLFDYIPAKEAVDPLLFKIIEVINQDRKILKVNAENGQLCQSYNCQFAEYLYRFRGIFCWKGRGFQGEGGDATTSGGIMAG